MFLVCSYTGNMTEKHMGTLSGICTQEHTDSKTVLPMKSSMRNRGCWLIKDDLYNGCKTVLIFC